MIPCDREALGILRRCGELYLSDEDSLELLPLCRGRDAYELDRIFNGLRPTTVKGVPLAGMLALLRAGVPVAYFSVAGAAPETAVSKLPGYGYQEVIEMYEQGVDAVYAQQAAVIGFGYASEVIILHRAGVPFEYLETCVTRLTNAAEAAELWKAGVPAEYVVALPA